VPHTEIDLILVDGRSVRFDRRLRGGERIAVYPEFERFDISPLHRLRPKPLREPRFVADVHLGTLARFLRLLGFDTRYGNGLDDAELAAITSREKRILLTRDVGLLKRRAVVRGQWLRSHDPERQVEEIVEIDQPVCLECFDERRNQIIGRQGSKNDQTFLHSKFLISEVEARVDSASDQSGSLK